jgi:hypothetical protein
MTVSSPMSAQAKGELPPIVTAAIQMPKAMRPGRSNETYHVPWDLFAMGDAFPRLLAARADARTPGAPRGKRDSARATETFPSEREAKQFARAKLVDTLNVGAGTLKNTPTLCTQKRGRRAPA